MSNPDIKAYILKSREKEMSESDIRANLDAVGWDKSEIEQTFKALEKPIVPKYQPGTDSQSDVPRPAVGPDIDPIRGNMWDSFEHVLLFLSLFGVAAFTGSLLHQFIDGPGEDMYYRAGGMNIIAWFVSNYNTLLRIYVAILIVCTPLFAFLFLDITRRTLKHPDIRKLRTRKILIYFTLVITFIMGISKLIALVYNVLGGSINGVYFLHFLVTFGIAGAIFVYYLYQIREDRKL